MSLKIYDILEERAMQVIEENGDGDLKIGVGKELISHIYNDATLSLEPLYRFAEHYGVSVDYLLGRSEVESVF